MNVEELNLEEMTLGERLRFSMQQAVEHSKGNVKLRTTKIDLSVQIEMGKNVPHEDVLELAEVEV
ncbi:MAG: hypothetical protein FWG65_10580 [Turicibacter sp.]|nr:hypothetical protein [Turicibacter sp.]